MPHMLTRALRHRNYRRFFVGYGLSLIGTWLARVATSWLVYRLTESSFYLGVVTFASHMPTFIVSPIAGVVVDRVDRRMVLIATQLSTLMVSATIAALTITGAITLQSLVIVSVVQGLINAFDVPARQSLVVRMVDDKLDLPNAIALNSMLANLARVLGPSIGGVLIVWTGEGYCFVLDAVSSCAVLWSLATMHIKSSESKMDTANVLGELREGFEYALGSRPIRNVLVLFAFVNFMGMPFTVLVPAVSAQLLKGDAATLGFLMAASGCGAVGGSLYLASRPSVMGFGKVVVVAGAAFGVGLIAFSCSHAVWLSIITLVPTGMGAMVQMAASNIVLQTIVHESQRGRVMSFFAMASFGAVPLGSLVAGFLSDVFNPATAIALSGTGCILGVLLFGRALLEIRCVSPLTRAV
jgi:MFS family permease